MALMNFCKLVFEGRNSMLYVCCHCQYIEFFLEIKDH
jgi:hypothetical protein